MSENGNSSRTVGGDTKQWRVITDPNLIYTEFGTELGTPPNSLSTNFSLNTSAQQNCRLQCLETTEESTDLIRIGTPLPIITAPVRSSYKLGDSQPQIKKNRRLSMQRVWEKVSRREDTVARKDCPAFSKSCSNRGIKGLFRAVCQEGTVNQT